MISADRFFTMVSDHIFGGRPVESYSRLVEDLDADSLALLELRIAVEEVAGRALPDDLWAEVGTLGEVYEWYATLASQRPEAGSRHAGSTHAADLLSVAEELDYEL